MLLLGGGRGRVKQVKKKKLTDKNKSISKAFLFFIFSVIIFHWFSISVFGRNCFRRGNSSLILPTTTQTIWGQCMDTSDMWHNYAQHTTPRVAAVSGTRGEGGHTCATRQGQIPFAPTWLLYILLEMSGLVTGQGSQVTQQGLARQRKPEAMLALVLSEKIRLYGSPGIRLKWDWW